MSQNLINKKINKTCIVHIYYLHYFPNKNLISLLYYFSNYKKRNLFEKYSKKYNLIFLE